LLIVDISPVLWHLVFYIDIYQTERWWRPSCGAALLTPILEPHTSERVGGMLDVDVSTDSDVKNFPGGKMTRLARAGQLH